MPRQIEWSYYIPPDVTVATDGTIADWTNVYSFDDREDRFEFSFTGWGMPPIDYITQQGPFQDGVSLLDYRLKPRVVQLTHRRVGGCRDSYWDMRSDLVNILRMNRGSSGLERGRLRRVLPDGSKRDLYVVIEQGPRFEARDPEEWDEWSIFETLRFIAHDPIIFNPAQQSASWTISETSELIFPIEFPIIFGAAIINNELDVTYNGTWLTHPTITITGPLYGPIIQNNSTDEEIVINYDVEPGDTLTLDLNYGVKTVEDADGTNRIGTVTPDSDLATFHIAPAPQVSGGVNTLKVIGGNADDNTAVAITWYDKYIGI
jgi:hypothetical protein